MKRLLRPLALVAGELLIALSLSPVQARASAAWSFVPPTAARRGPQVGDLDGDGIDELIVDSVAGNAGLPSPPHAVSVWAYSAQAAENGLTETAARVEREPVQVLVVHDAPGFPGASVLVEASVETHLLRGTDLADAATYPACDGPILYAGDLEGDGRLEGIVGLYQAMEICDVATGAPLRWIETDANVGDIAVGQLDDDPALEIAIGGNPLRVFDAASLEIEWSYAGGAGSRPYLDAAAFGSDARFAFRGVAGEGVLVATHPLRVDHVIAAPANDLPAAYELVDTDGDGASELLRIEDGGYRALDVLDPGTGQLIYSIESAHSGGGGTGLVSLATAGSGATNRLVWLDGQDAGWTQPSSLFTVEARPGATPSVQGPESHFSMAVGDVDGDGADEVAVASLTGDQPAIAKLRALDRETGAEKWVAYGDQTEQAPVVAIAGGNSTRPPRIFMTEGTKIAVFDGVSRTELSTMDEQNPALVFSNLFTLRSSDVDADGDVDLVAADIGMGIYVLDPTTGAIKWHPALFDEEIRDVELVPRGSGVPQDFLIVQARHVALWSGASHAELWSTILPDNTQYQDPIVATYVPDGVYGPQVAVGAKHELLTYDANDGRYLWNTSVLGLFFSDITTLAAPSGRADRLLVNDYDGVQFVDSQRGVGSFLVTTGSRAGSGNSLFIAADPVSGRHEMIAATDGSIVRRSLVDRDDLFSSGFEPH
jgi:hypothetical protein